MTMVEDGGTMMMTTLCPGSGERPMRTTKRVEMRILRDEVIKKYVNRKSNSKEMIARYSC